MKKFFFLSTLAAACAIFISGCRSHVGHLTLASTRDFNQDAIDLDSLPQKKLVSGESTRLVFLIIPIGAPRLNEAVEDALNKGEGDLLVDASVYRTTDWTVILFTQIGIEVRGTVVNTKASPSAQPPTPGQEVKAEPPTASEPEPKEEAPAATSDEKAEPPAESTEGKEENAQ